jgi:DNA-directed RNA polymerase subunit F
MNILNYKFNIKILAFIIVSLFAFSCTDPKTSASDDDFSDNDTIKAVTLNVGGELFSIPSPIQTALLIQKSGITYDKSILNENNKSSLYISDFSKSLNLGIYGADLGYVSMYSQSQDALGYLASVKVLADKLGISAAFNQKMLTRIKDNISIKDSMLVLVGVAYRASDSYLKTNKRTEISSLILTGGWIESIYFSIKAYEKKPTNEIKYRIAEQKQALNSLIKLLSSHSLTEASELLNELNSLAQIFEGITYKYVYVEPSTDETKKLTYINSSTNISISEEQLGKISEKISDIRLKIINSKPSFN